MLLQTTILLTTLALSNATSQPSVLIIGAGASGVAAATRLLSEGFTNITVLEAQSRIGGRIHSVYFGEAFGDLGARRCHGEEGNVVYQLVKDLGLLRRSGPEAVIYHSRYKLDEEFNERLKGLIWEVYYSNTTGVDEKVEEYYRRRYTEVVNANVTDPLEFQVATSALRLLLQFVLSRRASLTLDDVILNRDYRICPGDLHMSWNGSGEKTVLDVLIKRLPDPSQQLPFDEKVELNKEVTNIEWGSSPVKVTCADGSSYLADHVIFTPSIGVLKHDHLKFFSPNLPEAKRTAVEDIGFGALMDASLYFPESWWPSYDEFTGYYFVWDPQDAESALDEYRNATGTSLSSAWILDLYYVEAAPNNPHVLTLWIIGTSAVEAEQISDEELINGTLFVFNKFLDRSYNITRPTQLIRSSWYSNPHIRGAISYQTQRAHDRTPSAEVELSLPLCDQGGRPVVQFAGEATHPHFYSTVHGAVETGFREADRLLRSYRN